MKEVIQSNKAPAAIGPYSQGIKSGNMVFISGQIPIDVATGDIPEGIEDQTKQVLKNIKEILKATDLDMNNIVKTTVFMKDLGQFVQMNEVYASFFGTVPPARATVEVARLPKDVMVEIEAIAVGD